MNIKLQSILKEKFGHTTFRPGQEEAISAVLKGEDTLIMLPTGTGKSLCYQLPAYLQDGIVLVVSPLLSLMQDQVESLRLKGEKRVAALNSLTSIPERERIFKQINQYRFIYTSPEMLQNPYVLNALKRAKINLFVVDEAHCISHWGTDFRPDYLILADIRKELGYPITMALTATATEQVRSEIIRFLGLEKKQTTQIIQSVDRSEIKYLVENCQSQSKDTALIENVQKLKGPGIIYFMSKKLADYWAEKLTKEYQIHAASYHADIETNDKIKIQQQFLNNTLQIVCATSAFGMGFDKEDIRFVIHYHLPASPEMYLQEIGRASRDGKESVAILLYQPGDEQIQKRFIDTSLPTVQDIQNAYQGKDSSYFSNEAIFKLANYFIHTYKNIDQVLATITERKTLKEKQLSFMMEYVFYKGCKRKFLLQYFGEHYENQLKQCCMNCEIDIDNLFTIINEIPTKKVYTQENNEWLPWEIIFQGLYNNSNDSDKNMLQ